MDIIRCDLRKWILLGRWEVEGRVGTILCYETWVIFSVRKDVRS